MITEFTPAQGLGEEYIVIYSLVIRGLVLSRSHLRDLTTCLLRHLISQKPWHHCLGFSRSSSMLIMSTSSSKELLLLKPGSLGPWQSPPRWYVGGSLLPGGTDF